MSIVSLLEARAALRIPDGDDSVDEVLTRYVNGITQAIETYKREVIEEREVIERVRLTGSARFRLWSVPVISLDSLVSLDGSTTWATDGMLPDPETGLVDVLSGPAPRGVARATYTAGHATVPESYKQGALIVLMHVWETQRGPGQVMPGVVGSEEARDVRYMYTFPRKAREWLGAPRPVVG